MASIPDAPLLVLEPHLIALLYSDVGSNGPQLILYWVNFIPEPISWETISGIYQPSPLQPEKDPYSWSVERWGLSPYLAVTPTSSPTLSHSFVV